MLRQRILPVHMRQAQNPACILNHLGTYLHNAFAVRGGSTEVRNATAIVQPASEQVQSERAKDDEVNAGDPAG